MATGYLVEADHGTVRLRSRSGRDVTGEYPQLALAGSRSGRPPRGARRRGRRPRQVRCAQLQRDAKPRPRHPRRVLGIRPALPGRPFAAASQIPDRRKLLETLAGAGSLIVPEQLPGDGAQALEHSASTAGKAWSPRSATPPTSRAGDRPSWVKDKHWNTQEVVIGGWRAGEGGRTSGIGALLMGIPGVGGLQFAGRVGTGFTERDLSSLKKTLAPLHTDESPFETALPAREAKAVTFVRAGAGGRGALQRMDPGQPAAPAELARAAAGQETK